MIKKLASCLIAILIILNFSLYSIASTEKDLEKYQTIQALKLLDVIKGYGDNTLKLEESITRAELVAIVCRIKGLEGAVEHHSSQENMKKQLNGIYKDVSTEHWANPYIHVAHKIGLIEGIENNRFDPDAKISCQDAVTVILRALRYEFHVSEIGNYPEAYLYVAKNMGILENINLDADNPVSRKDAMQMIYNCLNINLMVQASGPGPNWQLSDRTFLTSIFEIDKNYGKVNNVRDNYIYIDNEKYKIGIIDEKEYIGSKVCFYYIETEGKEKVIVKLDKV